MTLNQRYGSKAYANIGIQTRGAEHDQYELALLMFEAVMENGAAAQGAIQVGHIAAKAQHLHKCVRILQDGLLTSLDLENGGELAANLADLYGYCILRLTQANIHNDAAAIAEVLGLLDPVIDAWKQIRQPASNTAQAVKTEEKTGTDTMATSKAPAAPPNKLSAAHAYNSRFGGSVLAGA